MTRANCILAMMFAGGLAAAALSGCTGPKPFIRESGADSVEIGYSGDVASTMALARGHCAGFERVPRLVQISPDSAVYDCVRP